MVKLTILPPWGYPTPPIGLGYLSEYLTRHGVEHGVIDLNLRMFQTLGQTRPELWSHHSDAWLEPVAFARTLSEIEAYVEDCVDLLSGSGSDLVGFSVTLANRRLSVEVARRLRERVPDTTIVFGGLGVYIEGERRLIPENVVDLFVMGEGEQTLLEIVRRHAAGAGLHRIPGTLQHPCQGEGVRPFVDLRSHPWPRYARFPISEYPQPMPILLGRGCICRCTFCGDYAFWGRYRARNPDHVVDELTHHVQHHGVPNFEFNDLTITADLDALQRMCDGIIGRGLDISWFSFAHVRRLPPTILDKMRRAGCFRLRFGLESGSPAVRARMRKGASVRLAAETFQAVTEAGIECNISLIVGFPGETEAEFEETLKFLCENQAHIHRVESANACFLKPLSDLDRHRCRYGVQIPEDHTRMWSHWEGLDGSTLEIRAGRLHRLLDVIAATRIQMEPGAVFGVSD